jgi:regulator of replication initiation timing
MENTKVVTYLESLEVKVKKLVAEHGSLKDELRASMEENKGLTIHAQNLEDEIISLNHKKVETGIEIEALWHKLNVVQEANKNLTEKVENLELERTNVAHVNLGFEKGEIEAEMALLQEENKRLIESLTGIEEHIKDIQLKSEALLIEFDRVQNSNLDLAERNIELETAYKQYVASNQDGVNKFQEEDAHNGHTYLLLEASRKELQQWKEKAEKQEEALKNFVNQEKNSKIVESIAEDGTKSNELKLKINEYIKEIDKCIAQLSD